MSFAGSPVTLQEFCTELGYAESSGFYTLSQPVSNLPASIVNAKDKLGVDAVYGTHSGPNDRFKPVIYFKEYSDGQETSLSQIYNNVWNEGIATLLLVVFPDRVKIYNCTQSPVENAQEDIDKSQRLLETLELYEQSLKEAQKLNTYNRPNIESRNFWRAHHEEFDRGNRVDQHLLENLEHLKNKLTKDLSLKYTNNLIIRSIFILYLEDRNIISDSIFQREFGCEEYREVLNDKEDTYKLFNAVEGRLNGDIFRYDDDEYDSVTTDHLHEVRAFLNGQNLKTGQMRLFPYRFDLIPIELISSIYEHFVGESDRGGTFYTRPEMADYVLDEVLKKPIDNYEKIIDPTCGSGVFLVSAFSRIVESKRRSGETIDGDTLKRILSNRLYGFDNNPEAVRITTFSLSLKLIEYLDRSDIWTNEFELPTLIGNSVRYTDFFNVSDNDTFDLIIGNPPWGSLSNIDSNAEAYLNERGLSIGGNEAAQAFMWKALANLSENGEACLAVPIQKVLLYQQSNIRAFRQHFFDKATLKEVVNLSPLRDNLFKNSRNAAAIINFSNSSDRREEPVRYITPKMFNVEILRSIPIDAGYDVKYISKDRMDLKYI